MMTDVNVPNRIIITGDILRPCPVSSKPTQIENIKWFANLISFFIKSVVPQTPLEVLVWGKDEHTFPTLEFYKAEQLTANIEGWGKIYNREKLSFDSESILDRWFSNSLVISIELPDLLKNYFSRKTIPYFDFNLHSIRYADDLFFSLDTNIQKIYDDLRQYYVNPQLFSALAAIHKATLSRRSLLGMKEGSCLLVGQTEFDKVLIENGRFVALSDYEEKIIDLKNNHSVVYYKPHPYCVDKSLKYKLSKRYGFHILEENIYRCLCCAEITSFAAISSSVIHEAQFFGKNTKLLKDGHLFQDSAFSEQFLSTGFWRVILMKFFAISEDADYILPVRANRLRNSVGRYWGYNYLDFQLIEDELRGKKSNNFMEFRSYFPLTWRQKIASLTQAILSK